MIDDFIKRKHGKKRVSYELPQLQYILQETYEVKGVAGVKKRANLV